MTVLNKVRITGEKRVLGRDDIPEGTLKASEWKCPEGSQIYG